MKTEQIGISAEAIPGSRALVALPSMNPSMGPTLEIVGMAQQGYLIRLSDPMGELVWQVMLNAEGAIGGPDFGADSTIGEAFA